MKVTKTEIIKSLRICAIADGCIGCTFRHKSSDCLRSLLNHTADFLENNIIEIGNGQNYTTVQETEGI